LVLWRFAMIVAFIVMIEKKISYSQTQFITIIQASTTTEAT